MKLIPVSRGKMYACVDDSDYDYLIRLKWHLRKRSDGHGFYALSKLGLMHRLILNLSDTEYGDHKDGDGLNNQSANLRGCTHSQNMKNRGKHKPTRSIYKGIYFDSSKKKGKLSLRNRWRASINVNNVVIRLGRFVKEVDAAIAYDRAAIEYHGAFARTNFPVDNYM